LLAVAGELADHPPYSLLTVTHQNIFDWRKASAVSWNWLRRLLAADNLHLGSMQPWLLIT
jgi:hypothetical protein